MRSKLEINLFSKALELPLRRLLVLVLSAGLSGVLYWLWPVEAIADSLQRGVFYFSLIASGCCFFYVGGIALKHCSLLGRRGALITFLPAFVGCGIIFLHADFGFKVSMDDAILSASAKSLYEHQEYVVAVQGHRGVDGYEISSGYFDKRPWFYSFSVSVLHYLTGWRVVNAFVTNAFYGAAFIFIICACGKRFGGSATAWVGSLLAASIPLVAQNATGGGMDMANATFLALLFLLGAKYLERPCEVGEGALLSTVILLAYTRYESLLYVLPALSVVCLGWYLRGKVMLSLPALALAPLLLPVLLQNRYFRESELLWELHSNVQSPFALSHIAENFPRALYFLFNLSDTLANSAIASALGLVALVLILVWAIRSFPRQWREYPHVVSWGILTAAVVLNFFVLMAYHDGKLDRIFASRLALPLCISLILAPCIVIGIGKFKRRVQYVIIFLVSIYILGWTLPANARELFTKRNYVQNEMAWLLEVVGTDILENDLVIDQKSTGWILYEKQTMLPRIALERIDLLAQREAEGAYDNIYYIERFEYTFGEDSNLILEPSRLPEGVFDLQPLIQRSFRPFSLLRVSRVKAIHPTRLPEDFLGRPPHGQRQDYDYDGL